MLHYCVGSVETFLRDFRTVSLVREKPQDQTKKTVAHFEFEKQVLFSGNEVEYTLYLGNAATVIDEQVKGCENDSIATTFEKQNKISHHLTVEIGIHSSTAVDHEIKKCEDAGVYWKCEKDGEIMFTSDCLQLLSNKSIIILFAEALQFYHLHATLLNFSDAFCQQLIESEKTSITSHLCHSMQVTFWNEQCTIIVSDSQGG